MEIRASSDGWTWSGEADPRLCPGDPRPEERQGREDDEGEAVEARGVLEEDPVVDREEDGGDAERDEGVERLPCREVSPRRARGRRVDHRDPDERQGERRAEEAEVEPSRKGFAQPRHGAPFRPPRLIGRSPAPPRGAWPAARCRARATPR